MKIGKVGEHDEFPRIDLFFRAILGGSGVCDPATL